jgi:epoxyqueuosine reductase
VNPTRAAEAARRLALAVGFDLAGVARALPGERTRGLRDWVERGLAGPPEGPLGFVWRRLAEREDPRRVFEGVQSIVVVGLFVGDASEGEQRSREALVARYARGDDYHEVLEDRLRALVSALEAWLGRAFEHRSYVDTGPVAERVFAAEAGLGWIGRNTMLIHPSLGSHVMLGVLLTELELTPDEPEPDHCGTCRACLDACPTQAFVASHVLDATRCLAYTTIEDPGPIPLGLREAQGERVFGCDVCQDVCPFNQRRGRTPPSDPLGLRARLAARDEWREPSLAWLLALDESAWFVATRRSAVRRARWRGLVRNALVVAGNRRDPALRPLLERHAHGPDPLLAEHARWALTQLESGDGA